MTPATNKLVGAKESRPLVLCFAEANNYQPESQRQGFICQCAKKYFPLPSIYHWQPAGRRKMLAPNNCGMSAANKRPK